MSELVNEERRTPTLRVLTYADGSVKYLHFVRTHKCPLCGRVIWRMISYHLNRYHKDAIWDFTSQETMAASVDRQIGARRQWDEEREWREM